MPLGSSFWVDETATVFVARYGSHHPSLAIAAPQAWQSWYYALIGWQGALFGYSEIATRVISVVAMGAFLGIFARLAARLICPEAAWFAVFACLALPGIDYQAANARPYALGMFVFGISLLLLIRWLDSGKWHAGLLFAASGALVLYIHLLFWPCCLVFAFYTAARVAEGKTSVTWRRVVLIFAAFGALIVPVVVQSLALLRDARAHVVTPLPSPGEFARSLELHVLALCGGAAWVIGRARGWRVARAPLPASTLLLIAAWWLVQPVFLFLFSWVTGNGVFVPRYLQLALPGAALASTAAAGRFIPAGQWTRLAAVLGAGLLLYLGQWRTIWPRHHNSDWRAAASVVNEIEAEAPAPVVCPSPFVEARPPAWEPDYPLPGFLYTHLAVYPIHGKPYLFPFETSPQAELFAATVARGALLPSRRFLIYGWGPQVNFWRDWFARRPEFAAWRRRRLGPFADVDVVLFERVGP
ncbi:MAG TPA: hypothetical protein VGF16_03340 [Bryobacteraceae bacterium]|jgi:mannosyltransferase